MISSRTRKRDGRKVYDVRLRDTQGRTYNRTFDTLREAKAFEAGERTDRTRGAWLDPRRSETTFAAAATSWMEASAHKRPSSIARDKAILAKHLLPVLGTRSLASIGPTDIQRLVNTWTAVSPPASVVRQYASLRSIFNHAVNMDLILRSPCRGIRLPPVEPRESTLVTAADIQSLAAAMPGLEAMPYLGGVLGLRWGEIAGLRVAAVDFLRLTLVVDRQRTRGEGGAMVIQRPKTRAGRRTLSVPDWLMVLLADHLRARSLTAADPDETIFAGPDGKPLQYSNWRQRVWIPGTVAAGFPGLRFHDLRHTAGTALVLGGIDVKTAQTRLGHATPLTTLRIYAQATASADQDAARRLGELFHPTRPDSGITRDGRAMEPASNSGGEGDTTPDLGFSGGARRSRTSDLSIISAAL